MAKIQESFGVNYSTTTGTSLNNSSSPFGAASTPGNFYYGTATYSGNVASSTISDTDGNTGWTRIAQLYNATQGQTVEHWYCPNIVGGATPNIVTINYGASKSYRALVLQEHSGVATSNPLVDSAINYQTNPGTGTDAITSTVATAVASCLACGGAYDIESTNGSLAAGTNWTSGIAPPAGTGVFGRVEHRDIPSAGDYAATFTTASGTHDTITCVALFALAGSGVADAGTSAVTADPASIPADGITESTITVTVRDSSNNLLSGKTVTLSDGAASSVITPASDVTDANGVATFTVTDETIETATYTATVTTDSVEITDTAQVQFTDPAAGATPAITDVDTDESFSATQESVVITGTGFNSSQGTGSVLLVDGALTSTQSIVSWADTSISFDAVFGDCRYGARTLRVTNSDDNSDDIAVTITVPSGKAFIDLTSVNETAENRITATPDLAAGDQLEISNVQGGTIADVTLYADATFDCAESVTAFDVRANDGTGWGAIATQTVSAPGAVASATTSTVQAAPTAVYADGVTAATITATVRDASSNPLSGKVVTLGAGGGSSIITTVQGTTDVDGHAVFTVVDDTAETVVYTATVTTDSVQISQTAQVEFATPPGGSAEDDQPTQNVTTFFYAQ